MALCNSTHHFQSSKSLCLFLQSSFFFFFFITLPYHSQAISFDFPNFRSRTQDLITLGDASPKEDLQLTEDSGYKPNSQSFGRAIYREKLHLWSKATQKLADFDTFFSFTITQRDQNLDGDGLTFFLSSNGSDIPVNQSSAGGYLGLFNATTALNGSGTSTVVAAEFDNYNNTQWDVSRKSGHIGIDVNSIRSNATHDFIWRYGGKANAWISYNSVSKNLSVFMTYDDTSSSGPWNLSYRVDLATILPEWVDVGLSAATGDNFQAHSIHSWRFNSTDIEENKNRAGWLLGLTISLGVLLCGLCLLLFYLWKKRARKRKEDLIFDEDVDDDFENETGPKRFTYGELATATSNFSEDGKLGEGGFGGVYKGHLSISNLDVAVKRIKKGSKQGKREFVSEVKIISRLRHRNLVQLFGWCHERGELLLVYEFLPNGSLDSYLFGEKGLLPWVNRYKIATGLASALLYLHEEWDQCVVHRDIKSSNIMLDSAFNAKLGDFGLARLVDHDLGMRTTVLAGTMGYLAPECVVTGKASKESDVYSFGVVALEIACGRRPVDRNAEADKVSLLEWVWALYARGKILEAADERLTKDFDEKQMECLMLVGLWCSHPDHSLRPSTRQVISVLNFESPLPVLPYKMPAVPMYFAPRLNSFESSHAPSSEGATQTGSDKHQSSCKSYTTDSSNLLSSSTSSPSSSLLYPRKVDV